MLYVAFCSAAATIFGLNAVSVATPSLAYTLSAELGEISTATTVYLLMEIIFMCSLPVWLRYAGATQLLKWGSLGFLLSSLACFAAPDLTSLIVSRAIQGAFGGVLLPLPLLLVQQLLPKSLQYEGMNRYGMSTIVIPVLAPLLTLSLPPELIQWVFIVVGALALPGCFIFTEKKEVSRGERVANIELGSLCSFIVFAFGVGVLVLIIEYYHQWGGFSELKLQLSLLLGLTMLLCGITWQTRYTAPLFDWRLFTHAKATKVLFMSLLSGSIVYGMIYLIPLYVVMVHEASPSVVFSVVLAAALPQIILFLALSRVKHYLIPHISVASGFFILGAMSLYLSQTGIDFGPGEIWKSQLARALGVIILILPFNALLLAATPQGLSAGMGVMHNFIRTLGGAISIALTNAYITHRHAVYTQDTLAYGGSGFNSQYAAALAFNDAFTIMGGLLFLGGVVALTLNITKQKLD